jgi:hypothetical protein
VKRGVYKLLKSCAEPNTVINSDGVKLPTLQNEFDKSTAMVRKKIGRMRVAEDNDKDKENVENSSKKVRFETPLQTCCKSDLS